MKNRDLVMRYPYPPFDSLPKSGKKKLKEFSDFLKGRRRSGRYLASRNCILEYMHTISLWINYSEVAVVRFANGGDFSCI